MSHLVRLSRRKLLFVILWLLLSGYSRQLWAAIQFDVFLGFDGIVQEAAWFPVVCEIKNDGPSFNGIVAVAPGGYGQVQTRRAVVELPTGTLKRIVVPVFPVARGFNTWDVRLLDEAGRIRAEQLGQRPRGQLAPGVPLMAALARTPGGTPNFRPSTLAQFEWQPAVARLQSSIFPDNPLVLEAVGTLYLNSEKALELSASQAAAVKAWVLSGGHLVIPVEQVADINSRPWVKEIFPLEVSDIVAVGPHSELQQWVRDYDVERVNLPGTAESGGGNPFSELAEDKAFEAAELQVATGRLRPGARVDVSAENNPLIVTGTLGRGRVTALLFSPEREPARSWRNLPAFWSRLAEVPLAYYTTTDYKGHGNWSTDAVFGAMTDSRQVNKLPVWWLLLLLVVYLVVIGPLDQYWLKKIRRPMLTWITFPSYVVLFSLLIYFIGYMLRAGESELNEINVVDQIGEGATAQMRGRTYMSLYSPSNQRYPISGRQQYATLRNEAAGLWGGGGGEASDRGNVTQKGDSFSADVFVPVWTSQLLVSDWWQPGLAPLKARLVETADAWRLEVHNRSERKLSNLHLAVGDRVLTVDDLSPGATNSVEFPKDEGRTIQDFVRDVSMGGGRSGHFVTAVQSRQQAFGGTRRGQIDNLPEASICASFIASFQQPREGFGWNFVSPAGLDLGSTVNHGSAVLLAWDENHTPAAPMNQFMPRRLQRHTLWRVVVTPQKL